MNWPRNARACPGGEPGRLQIASGDGDTRILRDPLLLAQAAAELLEQSDERDHWERYLLDVEQAAYAAGYADGRAAAQAEADRSWAEQPARVVSSGDDLADVEARRWELRGEQRTRETFGRPHPADYQPQRQESAA